MKRYKKIIIFVLIVANLAAWSFVYLNYERDFLTVSFLDVGQGDAIFIEAPNGNQILIDTGPSEIIARALSDVLPYFDRHIDFVLTTHPDLDHISGMPTLLERYSVGSYIFYDNSPTSDIIEKIARLVEETETPVAHVQAGDRIVLDASRNIYLDVLWPTDKKQMPDKNDMSIITKLVYGESDVFLTGDASLKIENILVSEYTSYDAGIYLQSDILKLGHHGSKTSSSELFLRRVMPEFSIVSAGLNNRYNHPSADVTARLERLGFPIIKTTDRGSVIFRTDGATWWRD